MDIDAMRTLIRGIIPPSIPRRPHKYWVPYAWMVRMLVEAGMGVSDAVRAALRNSDMEIRPNDVASLRVVYYKIKELPWPEGMLEHVGTVVKETVGDHSDGADEPDMGLTEEERRELQEEEARMGALAEQNQIVDDPDADPDFQPEEEFEV